MSKTKELKFHPIAEYLPLMEGKPFLDLVADIGAHGLREPIRLLDGKILDGRNRFRACQRAGVKPRFVKVTGKDAKLPAQLVQSLNLERRHLDPSQLSMIAADLADLGVGRKPKRTPATSDEEGGNGDGVSQAEAADMVGVSVSSVKKAKTVKTKGHKAVQEAVKSGKLTVSKAEKIAKLPKARQAKIAKGGVKAMEAAARPSGKLSAQARQDAERSKNLASGDIKTRLLQKIDDWWLEAKNRIANETPFTVYKALCAIVEKEL